MRPALFLDRDGVINVDRGYVHTPEETQFIPGIFELVACANRHRWLTVVITNQAGIGRGLYSRAQFTSYMEWVRQQFLLRGAHLDAVYFCPHHPLHGVGEFKRTCECRKPNPGMLLSAIAEHGIAPEQSAMIGDSWTDMQAAQAAAVRRLFLMGNAPAPVRLDGSNPVQRVGTPADAIGQLWPGERKMD